MDTFKELDDLIAVFGLPYSNQVPTNTGTSTVDDEVCKSEELVTDELVDHFLSSTCITVSGSSATPDENGEDREVAHTYIAQQPLPPPHPTARGDADTMDDPQSDLSFISEKVRQGCGCSEECIKTVHVNRVLDNIMKLREMVKETREAHLLSNIVPVDSSDRCKDNSRKRIRCSLYFGRVKVCRSAFQVIFDVKKGTVQRLQHHVCNHGIEPRVHGLTGRRPGNALSHVVIRDAIQYVLNLSSEEGLPHPAPLRGRTGYLPIYLPVCKTKQSIHSDYVQCSKQQGKQFVGLSTFKDLWKRCVPHIQIMGPKEDVYRQCEGHIEQISLARTEDDKVDATSRYHGHVLAARTERGEYKKCVNESAAEFAMQSGQVQKVHCTFDFSQYLKLPHHAREKGPTFFIQPRKVQLFGFRVDGFRQYNFLVDEDQTIGKDGQYAHGPDSVISMVDHAFTNFNVPGDECRLHADNCFGQNKNRFVLAYFSWRTMTGRHEKITYMMQLPGHTRCLIDARFGRIKQKYHLEDTDTVEHLASVVERSSLSNVAVLYGGWCWRSWKEFLGLRFKKVPNVNSYYYFRFEATDPGAVYMKRSAVDTEETRFVLCKTPLLPMSPCVLPDVVQAAGLSHERMRYLFKHVRPLVRVPYRDVLCPNPDT